MSPATDPATHIWWIVSRALGVVALVLVSASVALGLLLSARAVKSPGAPAWLKHLHEATALCGLAAIVSHGAILLGDSYLRPDVADLLLPFRLTTNTFWTGLGVVAGWLAAILGLSFYVRRWIGVAVWRWLHRWTLAVYLLAIAHTLGAGTDAGAPWMRLVLLASLAAPLYAAAYRFLPGKSKGTSSGGQGGGRRRVAKRRSGILST